MGKLPGKGRGGDKIEKSSKLMEGRKVKQKLSLNRSPVLRAGYELLSRHGKMVTLCEYALIKVNVKFVLHILITYKIQNYVLISLSACVFYMTNDNV